MIKCFRSIQRFSKVVNQQKLSLPSFQDYRFSPAIMQVLEKKQIFTPSPIQDLCITEINKLTHNNFIFIGPTGTGKTLAYALPLIDQLKKDEEQAGTQLTEPLRIRSLVIVPSKELVDQVTEVFKEFAHVVKLRCLGLTSAQKMKHEEEELSEKGVDVVVSTIDRVERHRQGNSLYTSKLRYLVIDEVDTLIDSGNEEILGNLCKSLIQRQISDKNFPKILLVGATCTNKFEKFIESVFGKNIKYVIEKNSHMHLENLSHEFIHCTTLDKKEPMLLLMRELQNKYQAMLIFCNTITSCQFIERVLIENKMNAISLHGSVPRNIRIQNVQSFRSRQVKIMVATDLAARGLDFPFLTHVLNFDFPTTTSDYLHRAGRSGRAGRKGYIYSLYHNKDETIINELKESSDKNVPLKIQGSSYSKINREILERDKKLQRTNEVLSSNQLDRLNQKKELNLPDEYLEARRNQKSKDFGGRRGSATRGSGRSSDTRDSRGNIYVSKSIIVPGYKPSRTIKHKYDDSKQVGKSKYDQKERTVGRDRRR